MLVTRELRLGVLGMSDGNGHPYSWSAIFNGFDPEAMKSCPFPVIPEYLAAQSWPDDAISGARVTRVWTQDRAVSEHVAAAALIDRVVDDYREMIGDVDGVLLARDDAENHLEMCRDFLAAGLPVYVDKPLALSVDNAKRILALEQRAGQVFSCSALRYAEEFRIDEEATRRVGTIRHVRGVSPKSWDRYAIHLVDAVLGSLGSQGTIKQSSSSIMGDATGLHLVWESGLTGTFTTTGSAIAPLALEFFGDSGHLRMEFRDAFSAFKAALDAFVDSIRTPGPRNPQDMLEAIAVVESGRRDEPGRENAS